MVVVGGGVEGGTLSSNEFHYKTQRHVLPGW